MTSKRKISNQRKRNLFGGSTQMEGSQLQKTPSQTQSNMRFTMQNHVTILGFLTPYIIIAYFILSGIFHNKYLNSMFYLMGLIFTYGIAYMFTYNNGFGECNFFGPANLSSAPYPNLSFIVYTLSYIVSSMMVNNNWNVPVVIILLIMSILSGVVSYSYKCATSMTVIISSVIGIMVGIIWSSSVYGISPTYLYFSKDDDKISCKENGNQEFKCDVYQNGQILTSTTTSS